MSFDIPPVNVPTNEALVDAFVAQVAAFLLALHRADLSCATPPELRRLVAVVDEVEDALDPLVAAVAAANAAD